MRDICAIFRERGAYIYYVELQADLDERLRRNTTPNRLACKPTKRDTAFSERNMLRDMQRYRLASHEGEVAEPNYLRLDNTQMPAQEAARRIVEAFGL